MQVPVKDCVSLTVYSFTFLLGLPSNLLVLFVYVRKARKRGATPNVVYALNLCLANLALVAWLPVKALETFLQDWALPSPLCPVYSFFLFSSMYGSCLFLTAVTVGRYLSIAFPISYKLYRRGRISCFISAALWAVVLLHLSLGLVAEGGGGFVSTSSHNVSRRVLAVALSTLAVFVVCYVPYNASHIVGFVLQENVHWRTEAMLSSACNVFLEPVVMLMLSPATPRGLMGRLCGRPSRYSRTEGRHCSKTITRDPLANVRGVASLTDRQTGANISKLSQEKSAQTRHRRPVSGIVVLNRHM
ncbi:unnamed protein product [Oncorhynchus mykiss]|uniref:G-protein coupled receptors family 1 profile domain-containing protein n=1 Tax=Oncorhynchus mykiss TaxID=8022 RepID=A0A060W8T5_ONCMY|nr:unnamed protein product [Oncorhynchus mykiss]